MRLSCDSRINPPEFYPRRDGRARLDHYAYLFAIAVAVGLMSSCVGGQMSGGYEISTGGDAHLGRQMINQYGCGKCHMIPGISGANGVVGPPLNLFARRTFIAGEFPNSPDNLTSWIMNPKSMKPKTAMPELGITEDQARDVAAYLYTLR